MNNSQIDRWSSNRGWKQSDEAGGGGEKWNNAKNIVFGKDSENKVRYIW